MAERSEPKGWMLAAAVLRDLEVPARSACFRRAEAPDVFVSNGARLKPSPDTRHVDLWSIRGARTTSNELYPREGIGGFCVLSGTTRSVMRRMEVGRAACQPFQKRVGDLMEGEHSIDGIEQNGLSRHSENDGCRLVLRDGESSGVLHLKHADCPIRSHPGEQYAESIFVDGGKMAIHGFAPVDVNGIFTSNANDGHVVAARSQPQLKPSSARTAFLINYTDLAAARTAPSTWTAASSAASSGVLPFSRAKM